MARLRPGELTGTPLDWRGSAAVTNRRRVGTGLVIAVTLRLVKARSRSKRDRIMFTTGSREICVQRVRE